MGGDFNLGIVRIFLLSVEQALRESGYASHEIINACDVDSRERDGIHAGNIFHPKADFTHSFLRYPYDLIPPHSKSYKLREEIEFYKSLALLFDDISLNRLSSTWMLRNRLYSLSKANNEGVRIAEYVLTRSNNVDLAWGDSLAVKAIGNCFVSEETHSLSEPEKFFFCVEEDDGDSAVIFPASKLDRDKLNNYINSFGHAFIQRAIHAKSEYRGYLIGKDFFIYKREDMNHFDKSAAKYIKTNHCLSKRNSDGIQRLALNHEILFLCFDFVIDSYNDEYVIDINPYGSMPKFNQFPEPSLSLASLLIN